MRPASALRSHCAFPSTAETISTIAFTVKLYRVVSQALANALDPANPRLPIRGRPGPGRAGRGLMVPGRPVSWGRYPRQAGILNGMRFRAPVELGGKTATRIQVPASR